MILVDSSVWIAHFRDEATDEVRKLRSPDVTDLILVGDLVLLEVLQGARDDGHASRIEAALAAFPSIALLDAPLVSAAAARYRALRARGVTVRKSADVIIASFCIERGHALLHTDRDFQPFVTHLGLREA